MEAPFEELLELAHEGQPGAMMNVAISLAEGRGTKKDEVLANEWMQKCIAIKLYEKDYDALALVGSIYETGELLPHYKDKATELYSAIFKVNPVIGNYLFGRSAYKKGTDHIDEAKERLESSSKEGHAISSFLLWRIRIESNRGITKKIASLLLMPVILRKFFLAKKKYGSEAFICWQDWFKKGGSFERLFIVGQ